MDFNKDYREFLEHITVKCGTSGPLKLSTEEKAAVRLFAAYLNCRYAQRVTQQARSSAKLCGCEKPMILEKSYCTKCGRDIYFF